MISGFSKQAKRTLFGLSLLGLASGCGTLTGATVGGAAGAGIAAARDTNIGRSAAIGAGIGGTLGAGYDVWNYSSRRSRDYYSDRSYD